MLGPLILKLQRVPKLLVGFVVISAVLIFMVFNDPPKTLCDIQMQEINKSLQDGFFLVNKRAGNFEAGLKSAYQNCLNSNSMGGCHDMFSRFDYLEGMVRTIPSECGAHASTAKIQSYLHRGLRLLAMIAWGDQPPINKYNKTNWLDASDIGLFCRLKRQYLRLYGSENYKVFFTSVIAKLPDSATLTQKDRWELSLFSYPCQGYY
jgi:hypothetical protein